MGRLVCSQLAEQGHNVRAFDLTTADFSDLPPGVSEFRGDLTSLEDVTSALYGVDAVVHLAAILPPVADLRNRIRSDEKTMLDELKIASMVGSPETVHKELEAFMTFTSPDELIISAQIYDHSARCRSYEITAEVAV